MSRITEEVIQCWRHDGWLILPEFFGQELVASALAEAYTIFPTPAEFKVSDDRYANLTESQFGGMSAFPFSGDTLSLLCVHEEIIALVEALLESRNPLMYQAQLWMKYQGAISYEQTHHRDYAKNTMLAPTVQAAPDFVELFIYLSDVSTSDGATAIVPMSLTRDIPLEPARFSRAEMPRFYENETVAVAPAGAVLAYRGDVFHRATEITRIGGFRASLKLAYKRREATWVMYHDALRLGFEPEWSKFVRSATARQLEAVGFPLASDSRWRDPIMTANAKLRYGHKWYT